MLFDFLNETNTEKEVNDSLNRKNCYWTIWIKKFKFLYVMHWRAEIHTIWLNLFLKGK